VTSSANLPAGRREVGGCSLTAGVALDVADLGNGGGGRLLFLKLCASISQFDRSNPDGD